MIAISQAIRKKICILYKKGMSLRQVADIIDVSHETIRTIIKPEGFLREQERKYVDKNIVKALFKKYDSYQKVANKLIISKSYVYEIINGRKIKKKRVRPKNG